MKYTAAVITVSDLGAKGQREDTSGPALCEILRADGWEILYTGIVPDEAEVIQRELIKCSDEYRVNLVLTTGGTGFSVRDVTPEATLGVLERETPGISEAMRAESMRITPKGCLSRGVAGIRKGTLIINLPGSRKAVAENIHAVLGALKHGADMIRSEGSANCGEAGSAAGGMQRSSAAAGGAMVGGAAAGGVSADPADGLADTARREVPSMDAWIKEAKADSNAPEVGMYLFHNGTVRRTAKERVRSGNMDAAEVCGMCFSYDEAKVNAAVEKTRQMEGIFYVRVWLNSGQLQVGDDLMYVLIGGDIRPHVTAALDALVGQLKSECVTETEVFAEAKEAAPGNKIGCVIMASGLGKRFGSNKLLAEFEGKTLLQRILDITSGELFDRRVVVTRSEAVKEICEAQGVEVIFHELPDRNDTVRLGIEGMKEMDGCLFTPCDQPLLSRESLKKLTEEFTENGGGIFRLAFGEKAGSPVLFGREYFEQLAALPPKCGGSYLIKKYPDQVKLVQAANELELMDVDTKEDLKAMLGERTD